jgi:hypothetical protein
MEVYLPSHLKPLVRELADEFGPETRSHSGQPRCRPDRHGDRILGPDTTEASKEQTMYDINDDESVYAFGVTQGEALFADAKTQGDPNWPVRQGESNAYLPPGQPGVESGNPGTAFDVGTPPDIAADHFILNAYLAGVASGLEIAYQNSPEGQEAEEEAERKIQEGEDDEEDDEA